MTPQSENALVARCLREAAEVIKPYQLSYGGLPLYVALNCRANELEAAEAPAHPTAQFRIIKALYRTVEKLGGKSDILAPLGSFGDCASDEDVLDSILQWNENFVRPQAPAPGWVESAMQFVEATRAAPQKPDPVRDLSEDDEEWVHEQSKLFKECNSWCGSYRIIKEALLRGRNSPQGASKP